MLITDNLPASLFGERTVPETLEKRLIFWVAKSEKSEKYKPMKTVSVGLARVQQTVLLEPIKKSMRAR